MAYKTILVHADLSRHAPARIALAAAIGAEHGAHLIGAAAMGTARAVFPRGYNVAPGTLSASCFDPLRQAARRALDGFEDIARRHGVACETRLVCDDAPGGLTQLARFADLVVLSQDDPDESLGYSPPANRMPDYVVFNAGRPVLVVPYVAAPAGCPRRILLCWNGSREASAAMAAALPLLRRAERVHLATLTPPFPDENAGRQELADALAFLARHAVQADAILRDQGRNAGQAILELAAELACDLVAMGCFGRSQLQELLLGGASRTVLRKSTVPVLMAR